MLEREGGRDRREKNGSIERGKGGEEEGQRCRENGKLEGGGGGGGGRERERR